MVYKITIEKKFKEVKWSGHRDADDGIVAGETFKIFMGYELYLYETQEPEDIYKHKIKTIREAGKIFFENKEVFRQIGGKMEFPEEQTFDKKAFESVVDDYDFYESIVTAFQKFQD